MTEPLFTLYGDRRSGNCMKVAFAADYLGIPYQWQEIDVLSGITRTPEFLERNPAGQVPVIVLDDGQVLSQSNAIMLYLARGSALIPEDPFSEALMNQWLFWEQYSHETSIAVLRFRCLFLGQPVSQRDPQLVEKGEAALDLMARHLGERRWFVDERFSLADIALVAYTRWAADGGFVLASRPAVVDWIERVESELGISDQG